MKLSAMLDGYWLGHLPAQQRAGVLLAKKSDKLTNHAQYFLAADLIYLASTADPSERRCLVDQILNDLNVTAENREIGVGLAKSRNRSRAVKRKIALALTRFFVR